MITIDHCKSCSHEVVFVRSEENNFIWPKVSRTGGTSILRGTLKKNIPDVIHNTDIQFDFFNQVEEKRFKDYYKFTFTRNPWDRVVSLYFIFKKKVGGTFNDFVSEILPKLSLPMEKVKYDSLSKLDKSLHNHCLPQHLAFWDGQNTYVDFIGRFENLEEDWDRIKGTIGLKDKVPHMSKTKHKDYRLYYNDNTKLMVEEVYKKDIEYLGYRF